jgi:hypothetical protein
MFAIPPVLLGIKSNGLAIVAIENNVTGTWADLT